MKKKSIFLSLVLTLMLGGNISPTSPRVYASEMDNLSEYEEGGSTCLHENVSTCCSACFATISCFNTRALEENIENKKISIKANKEDISKIVVTFLYDIDLENTYETEVIYNNKIGNKEKIVINEKEVSK